MKKREDLLKEYTKWTIEYVKAKEALDKLLPPAANLSGGGQMTAFVLTEESLAKYDEATKRVNNALNRRGEVLRKLREYGGH